MKMAKVLKRMAEPMTLELVKKLYSLFCMGAKIRFCSLRKMF